jgi:DHA3 family macrolide efflux protein-like MFS transporter
MSQTKSLKSFFIIWSGQAVSLLGSNLVQFALIWWLTQKTGSATILAMASLVGMLPQVILGPFAGVLVDRWNRRLVMLAADALVAIATLILAYLFWIDVIQTWHVFIILFVRSLGAAFHWPAMQASTSLMVPEDKFTRIQGLNQALEGGLMILSAPLGALLLSVLPLQGILSIDVITALFAIVPLLFIAIPQPPEKFQGETADLTASSSSYWQDLRAGLQFVWGWKGLLGIMLIATLINLFLSPAFSLLPLLITDHFGGTAWHLGLIESLFGVGIIVGGAVLSLWGGFKRRIMTTLVGLMGLGTFVLLIGLAPANAYYLAVVSMSLLGITVSMTNGPVRAIFQAVVPPDMQGRVFTLLGSASMAMSPLGLIIAGPVADALGVRTWYIVGGSMTILMGVVGFLIPAVLHVEDGRIPTTESPEIAEPIGPETAEITSLSS